MKTSIYFKQLRSLFEKPLPGPNPGTVSLEIWKRGAGQGSCASLGDTLAADTKAADLAYHLLDSAGKVVISLREDDA